MGLDMYLNAKRYLSDYNEADLAKKREMMNLFPELAVYLTQENGHPIKEITASVGYWRKANAIHGWFENEDCIIFKFKDYGFIHDNRGNSYNISSGAAGITIQIIKSN